MWRRGNSTHLNSSLFGFNSNLTPISVAVAQSLTEFEETYEEIAVEIFHWNLSHIVEIVKIYIEK